MSWTVVYLVLSVLCLSPGSVIIASGQGRMTDVKVLPESGGDGQCPSMEEREGARNEIHHIIDSVIATTASSTTMTCTYSCIYTCSGPGWRRVAFINMTDTSYNCPTGLTLTSYSKRTCGRSHTTSGGCTSTTFSVGGSPYSQVCGRIRGYQFQYSNSFHADSNGLNGNYVSGVSLTHGVAGSRQHIWTFAVGDSEEVSSWPNALCPCDASSTDNVPTFVGNDYFCESGAQMHGRPSFCDVLWDGQDCICTSTCCQFNNPPWFTKNLPNATTDDIELRLCTWGDPNYDDFPIELIELYVQ